MTEISILPQFAEGYFGQRQILEHLTLLIQWAEETEEELPPLLFTGAHGQGQRVLAGLIAERLTSPLHDLCLFKVEDRLLSNLTANGKTEHFESLPDLSRALPAEGVLFLEPESTVSNYELDRVVEQWSARRGNHEDAIYKFSNLIVRAAKCEDIPLSLRRRMAAHFHFGPNDDDGEFRLQAQVARWKDYAIDSEALRSIVSLVGGSDALGEKLLHLACKYSRHRKKRTVDAEDVKAAWRLFKDHLITTVDSVE